MSKEKILVVDDEEDILELVNYNLSREGYEVRCAASGEEGLKLAEERRPDLILLDLMLPGMDGLEICRIVKNDPRFQDILIIILSAKGEEADVVVGLEMGADDYVVKPFSPRVLAARIKSVLRRKRRGETDSRGILELEGLRLDPKRHEVTSEGGLLDLTATEFKILEYLGRRRGWVFTRSQIVDAVHGEDYPVTDRSIDVQMVGLRKKLGRHGGLVETVRGVGYRIKG